MKERLKWLMIVSSFQTEFDSKMDDEWKGGTMAVDDNKKTKAEEVGTGKKDLDSYCS
jgi:hypothetical protein